MLKLKSRIALIILLTLIFTNTHVFASEIKEAETASFASGPSLNTLVDNMSESDGVSYIYYNLGGAANNINNYGYITPKQKFMGLREPHKYGYKFDGWYLDEHFSKKADVLTYEKANGYVVYAKWVRTINNEYSVEHYNYRSNKKAHTLALKDCDYDFIDEIDIPGMPETKENDFLNNYIFSEAQCPQGICITDEYVLITSYSDDKGSLGELMVFDREDGEYLVTLGMDANSHLGGTAFDGENVWVCNSYENCVERISYDFIELMAYQNTGDVVDARDVVDEFPVKNTPSCITWYGGRLWIATHTLLVNSRMVAYYLDKKTDKLIALSDYKIPQKVQGVTFDDSGNVYLSTSYGRNQSSYLYCYDSVTALATRPKHPRKKVEMPPASEELDVRDNTLYILFESAGEKYYEGTDGKGKSLFPLDKILKIPIRELDVNGSSTSGT